MLNLVTKIQQIVMLFKLMAYPSSVQEAQIGSSVRRDFVWCFTNTVGREGTGFSEGTGALYAGILVLKGGSSKVYGGSTFDTVSRFRGHFAKGWRRWRWVARRNKAQRSEGDWLDGKGDKEKESYQRLYLEMAVQGVGNTVFVAYERLPVGSQGAKCVGKVKDKDKRKMKQSLHRAEHARNRQFAVHLNDRGMEQTKSTKRQKIGAKCRRKLRAGREERGEKRVYKERVWVSPLSEKNRELRGGEGTATFSWRDEQSVDLGWVLSRIQDGRGSGSVTVTPGYGLGTCWQSLRRRYGNSIVRMPGEDECELGECVAGRRCKGALLECIQKGGMFWVNIRESKETNGVAVKELMVWARKGGDAELEWLYSMEHNLKRCPRNVRAFVERRLHQSVRRQGGLVAPRVVLFKVQAGYRVVRRDVRRSWTRMVRDWWTQQGASEGMMRKMCDALRIVQQSGDTISGLLVNGGAVCRKARVASQGRSRCICHKHPEVVEVMKRKCPEVWAVAGHVHMPVMYAPWDEAAVASHNGKCEVSCVGEQVQRQMCSELLKLVRKCGVGKQWVKETATWFAENVRATVVEKAGALFKRGRVMKLKQLLKGWSVTVKDRNEGQLMMTCPQFIEEKLREHYQFGTSKRSRPEGVKYWLAERLECQILEEWKQAYQEWNRKHCAGRWAAWDDRGSMSRVRAQCKQKNNLKMRMIYACNKDPARKEMVIVAKMLDLWWRTADLGSFSVSDGARVAERLESIEADLLSVYGDHSRLGVVSDDFENYFPCNTKEGLVTAASEVLELVRHGPIAHGYRRPRDEWMSVELGKRGRARWGKSSVAGCVNRRTSDVLRFMEFRAEVANLFAVGDAILGADEAIIGEPMSPVGCNMVAALREREMLGSVDGLGRVCRPIRYVDDGLKPYVYRVSDTEVADQGSMDLVEAVISDVAVGYPGIRVTREGEATSAGGVIEFLEYCIAVTRDGKRLRWWFNLKNEEMVFSQGTQRLFRLKHWDSASTAKQKMQVVRSRLLSMMDATRMLPGWSGGEVGSGDAGRDLTASVFGFWVELVWCLGYPARRLNKVLQGLRLRNGWWDRVKSDAIIPAVLRVEFEKMRSEMSYLQHW